MDLHISAEHVFIACGYTDMRKSIDGFSGRRRPMKSGNSRRSSTAGSWKDSLLDSPGPYKRLRRKSSCKTAETLHKH
jgi:hypothetical protein